MAKWIVRKAATEVQQQERKKFEEMFNMEEG